MSKAHNTHKQIASKHILVICFHKKRAEKNLRNHTQNSADACTGTKTKNKQKNWNEKQIHIHKQIHKHWWMLIPDQTRKPPWFFFLYKCTSDRLKDKIVTASNIHLRQAIIYRVKHASLIIAHRCTLTHGKTEPTELWGLLFAESNTSCCC